jgi:hypothetical protein
VFEIEHDTASVNLLGEDINTDGKPENLYHMLVKEASLEISAEGTK